MGWACLLCANISATSPAEAQLQVAVLTDTGATPTPTLRVLPPKGFEDLLEPQTAPIDVHLEGKRIGVVEATFSPGQFRFTDSSDVVALIDGLKDPPSVRRALRGDLPSHEGLTCKSGRPGRCGTLRPPVAAVLFNPDRLRVDIVLAPGQRERVRHSEGPMTDTGFSGLVTGDLLTVTDFENNDTRGTASLNGLIGRGAHSLRASGRYTLDTDDVALDQLLWRSHREQTMIAAGVLRDERPSVFAGPRFLGLRVAPRADQRTQREAEAEPDLAILLPEPARIEIIADNRVIDVQQFDGGLANLDTRSFPGGARDLVLRVTDSSGTREERRFFARGAGLAPFGRPQFLFEAGALLREESGQLNVFREEARGDAFVRASTDYRLRKDMSLSGSLFSGGDVVFSDANLVWMRPRFDMRALTRLSTEGSGVRLSAAARTPFGSLSGAWTQVTHHGDTENALRVSLPPEFTESTVNASGRLGLGTFSLSASERRAPRLDRRLSWRATYSAPFGERARARNARWDVSLSRQQEDVVGRLGVRVHFGGAGRLRHDASADVLSQPSHEDELQLRAQLRSTYRNRRGRYDGERLSTRFRWERDQAFYNIDAETDHALASIEASLSGRLDEAEQPDLVTRWRSGAAFGPGGLMAADVERAKAGAAVAVDGDTDGAQADVLVNGRRQARVSVGQSVFVPLAPFRMVELDVIPAKSEWAAPSTPPKSVRLWPGAVAALRSELRRVRTVYGRLEGPQGDAIVGATLDTLSGLARTGEDGWFQVDIATETLIFERPSALPCAVQLEPEALGDGDIVDLGAVRCAP